MRKFGWFPPKCLVEQDVLGSRRQPLFAADDVGDAHQVVVDDVCQVVGGVAIALEEHLVVNVFAWHNDGATNAVVELDLAVEWDLEPDRCWLACCKETARFLRAERELVPHRAAVIVWCNAGSLLPLAHALELLWGIECVVCGLAFEKLLCVLAIDFRAFALHVRAELSTVEW
ncbi:hypothetical protein HRbin20_00978 [bacterium HR20]|nr:hypothetical protein HRbin20_00978 [bacterium HR20]